MSRNAYDICLTGHNLFACFARFFCCRLLHMFVCLMPYVCVLLACWFVSMAEKTVGRNKILWMFQKKHCLPYSCWLVRMFEKETVHECLKERKGMFGCPNNWSKHFWISEGGRACAWEGSGFGSIVSIKMLHLVVFGRVGSQRGRACAWEGSVCELGGPRLSP